jgi:hypothetical protein
MQETAAVETEFGTTVECSLRLLSAIQIADAPMVQRELARAARDCRRPARGSDLDGERAELLEAIVERMRTSPAGDTELFLLEHLTGATSRKAASAV